MFSIMKSNKFSAAVLSMAISFASLNASAGGEVGEHVNHLSDNLTKYTGEVEWIIGKIDGMVVRYEKEGVKAANSGAVVDYWEAVNFHAAIESNYVPLYASIWQGLYAVKESIDKKSPISDVRAAQQNLELALWQSLGAVKLAAQFQDRGLLAKVALREGAPKNSVEALDEIKSRLDRVTAKFAEKLVKESVNIVHDTYLNLFEGVEGELIALDANLVEDLEKDFNVTLPKALEGKSSLEDIRKVIGTMGTKLDKAKGLLVAKADKKKEVF